MSLSIFFRNLGQLFQQDQHQLKDTQQEKFDQAGGRLDRTEKRLDQAEPRLDTAERRIDAAADRADQAAEDLNEVRQMLVERLDSLEERIEQRFEEFAVTFEQRLETRLTSFEQTSEARLNSLESRLEIVTEKMEEQRVALAQQLAQQIQDAEAVQSEQFQQFDAAVDDRLTNYEGAMDTRWQEYQAALDARIEERLRQMELLGDERNAQQTATVEKALATQVATTNERFEERARVLDLRLDDRLSHLERNLDQRMTNFEKGLDQRLFTREKYIDNWLVTRSDDILTQTDVLLQGFDQRLDGFRRALRTTLHAQERGDMTMHETLQSLDQLSDAAVASSSATELDGGTGKSLIEQMVEWKTVAEERLLQFTPDEQEIVDYLMSFVLTDNPDEVHYVRQHLRRYIATLQRIPPATNTTARVLELGASGLYFTPVLQKFAGYRQIYCSNWSDIDAGLTEQKTLKQRDGNDVLTCEVKNFNAERDRFPYPDNYFSLVLCGELLEHLAHDPMHMLWECNRVLQPEGWLLLTTPNLSCTRALEGILCSCQPYLFSQYNLQNSSEHHHREYTPDDVLAALVAAGFTVVTLETEDVWMKSNPAILSLIRQLKFSDDLRGDDIFALARKTSAPVERYPSYLYVGVTPDAKGLKS